MWLWLFGLFTWVHLQLIEPIVRWWEEVVLGSWEEWLLALVRQGFEETTRFLNALGTWFLSVFSERSYREQLKRTWQENSWQQWWGEVATRPSTLNALVANLVAQQKQQQQSSQGNGEDFVGPVSGNDAPAPARVSPSPTVDGGSSAWWPRPVRQGAGRMGRMRQHGTLLATRLERPVVFVQQSGMGIIDELAKRRHGLIEDAKIAAQLAVSRCFDVARSAVRAAFFLPARDALAEGSGVGRRAADAGDQVTATRRFGAAGGVGQCAAPAGRKATMHRSRSAHVSIADMAYQPGAGAGSASTSMSRRGLQRSRSYGRLRTDATPFKYQATEAPSDALSIIRAAGYPHELHTITTDDGYVLCMERIPRPGARDVVFFMHGVLDTSMAWVSGGVTGSQAFAAWEAGMDVWLGNSRGNAPRQHQDPTRRGWRYWQYNINHMGMYDIAAQLDHIHNIKCAELGAGTVTLDLDHLGPLAGRYFSGVGGGGAGGKRMPPNSYAGGGLHLLPERAVSSLEAHGAASGLEGHSGPVAFRGGVRMRHSNSEGNLCHFGSGNSVSSGTRGAPLEAIGTRSSGFRSAGTPSEASTDLAPTTPQQPSPHHQCTGPNAAVDGPNSIASAASLGRAPSSQGMLTPVASCDEDQQVSGDAGAGAGAAAADAPDGPWTEQPCPRRALAPEPFGAADADAVAAGVVGTGELKAAAPGGCCPSMDGAGPIVICEAAQAAATATMTAMKAPGPLPRVRQNAVTLTVATPAAVGESDAVAARPDGLPAVVTSGPTTTFTLEAKTRSVFGSGNVAADSAASGGFGQGRQSSRPGGSSGTFVRPSQGPSDRPKGDTGEAGGSRGGNASASVLGVMNTVLGPAADAVSQAVASAGAAIATAAVSATQLLHASPQKGNAAGCAASSSAVPAAAQPTSATAPVPCPATSPFASLASQTGAIVSGAAVADIEGQGTDPCAVAEGARPAALDGPAYPGSAHDHQSPPRRVVAGANGRAALAKAAATAANGRSFGPSLPSPTVSGPRLHRRVCSTDALAAADAPACADGWFTSGGSAVFGPPRLAAPERSASGLSAGSCATWSGCGGPANGAGGSDGAAAAPGPGAGPEGGCMGPGAWGGGNGAASARRTAATSAGCPYKLRCVAHSLGGMSVLIHLINRLREGRPHHVTRLLLLTPAGFHKHCPTAARVVMWALPLVTRALRAVMGQSFCFPLYIPTPVGRALTFKLLLSASRIPGLGELLRLGFKALLNGDISQWDRALQMPHYSAQDMPAISVEQVLHLVQLVATDAFRLYDYGSPAANAAHYGSPTPPDVSREYWRLDLPVHLVGGRRDGIIPPPNIHRHLDAMRSQGVAVSYREFDFGHLDFTFGVKEELRMYLMKVLRL